MRLKTLLFALILACTLGVQAQTTNPPESGPKSSALDSSLFYQLLLSELSVRAEDPGTAFSLMLDAARKTNDPEVYRRAVQIALQARSGESALQAATAWAMAFPASLEANRFVLQILLGLNRIAETMEPLKRAIELTPKNERRELIWSIPANYERTTQRKLAALTVEKALASQLKDKSTQTTSWATIGRMWLSAEDKSKALSAATKGMALDTKSEHAALLALSLMAPGQPEAERLVKNHLPGARPEFRMAYIKTLLGVHREEDAAAELQSLRENSPDYADAWLIDGALALQSKQYLLAEKRLQRYLDLTAPKPDTAQSPESKRGRSQAYLSMSQIAQQRRDFTSAVSWLQRVDNPEDILRAQIRKADLIAQQGNVDEAIALIRNQTERSQADGRLKRSAEVQVLRDQKLYDKARIALTNFIAQYPDDLDMVYDLAMVNEKLGDLAEMERLLRTLITAKPEDPHAYNALGYSFADRNMRLTEARQLITKALALSEGDPFITDSLAWAEFRLGNNAEALRLLQKAFKEKPDAEIAAHLGEVLWASNRKQEATQVFREGIKLNPDNETLIQTMQRLQVPQ